jgi:hypothetical protein
VQLGASIAGAPGDVIAFTWDTDAGSYSPAQGAQTLGDSGLATLTTTFTAPAGKGTFGQQLSISSPNGLESRGFSLDVAVPSYLGFPNAFNPSTGGTTNDNLLLGQQVTTAAAATLVRLGLVTAAAGGQAQLALYSDSGSNPHALVASTPAFSITYGVNEVAVTTPTALTGATAYWVMAVFSVATTIVQSTASDSTVRYLQLNFGGTLPQSIPADAGSTSAGTYNLYAVVLE